MVRSKFTVFSLTYSSSSLFTLKIGTTIYPIIRVKIMGVVFESSVSLAPNLFPALPQLQHQQGHRLFLQTIFTVCKQAAPAPLLPPSRPPWSPAGLLLLLLTPQLIFPSYIIDSPQIARAIFLKHMLGHVHVLFYLSQGSLPHFSTTLLPLAYGAVCEPAPAFPLLPHFTPFTALPPHSSHTGLTFL